MSVSLKCARKRRIAGLALRLGQLVRADQGEPVRGIRRRQAGAVGAQRFDDLVDVQSERPGDDEICFGELRRHRDPFSRTIERCTFRLGRAAVGCAQAAPSNMLVTEPSSKTSWIARASSGAIGRIVRVGKRLTSGIGTVSVTTTSSIASLCSRSAAGCEKIACVAATITRSAPLRLERLGRLHDRAAGVDHVVHQQAHPAVDLADDLVDRDLVRDVRVAALVDDGEGRTEAVRPGVGDAHAAGVG